MCLIISSLKHKRYRLTLIDKKLTRFPIPIILKKDVVVWKELLKVRDDHYVTPFKLYPIEFKDKKCVLTAKFGKCKGGAYDAFLITKGIHAYTYPRRSCFKAIIPKGTKIYFGFGDIVAEKLIITQESYY